MAGTLNAIDAMVCQRDIVEPIVAGKGNRVISVKDNQPKLLAAIQESFPDELDRDLKGLRCRHHETCGDGHARIEERFN